MGGTAGVEGGRERAWDVAGPNGRGLGTICRCRETGLQCTIHNLEPMSAETVCSITLNRDAYIHAKYIPSVLLWHCTYMYAHNTGTFSVKKVLVHHRERL